MISDINRPRKFREAVEAQNLIYCDRQVPRGEQFHIFDLNYGELIAKAAPRQVKILVELSCAYAAGRNNGEHNALLRLIAYRDNVNLFNYGILKRLAWYCPLRVDDTQRHPEQWVSLSVWLSENGQTPNLRFLRP